MKPFSLYIFRHTALTHKSAFLKEHILRDHAGWSVTSKMPQVYIHYFGTESSKSILVAHGIVKNESIRTIILKPIQCPNCLESNERQARFCTCCKMILKYDAYIGTLEEQKKQDLEIQELMKQESLNSEAITALSDGLAKLSEDIQILKQRK
jgi:hypothetical protein